MSKIIAPSNTDGAKFEGSTRNLASNLAAGVTSLATTVADGLMSSDDKTKLDALGAGADITGVAITAGTGLSGSVTTTSGDHTQTLTHAAHTGDVTGAAALTIADDAVTYAKMQNVSATDRLLGRDTAGAGVVEEIAPTDVLTMLGVEAGATADQTNAEIRAAVEAASDSNVFTDADHTKLNGIESSATADQTDAEIRTAVEAATDSNVFTDADHTKLNGIEDSADVTDAANVNAAGAVMESDFNATTFLYAASDNTPEPKTPDDVRLILNVEDGATADQTNAEIRAAVEAASDSNVFTDAALTKLNGISGSNTGDEVAATETVAGIVELATTTEATTGTDTTRAVTPAGVKAAVDGLIDGAPAALDTLNELAAAIDDDASYASTITTALALKAPLASPTFTGTIAIPNISNLETTVAANTAKATNVTTDLSVSRDGTKLDVVSSDGTNAVLPLADTDNWGVMSDEMFDKLDGIEAGADVTDTTNVTAAGALMDSEVDADIKTLSLPASTTISDFGKTLIDDADAAAALTTLGVTSNATHTGQVTGATALTVEAPAITDQTEKTASAHNDDYIMLIDSEASNALKKIKVSRLPAGGGGSGHTIQEEGSDLASETYLNFVGELVEATDDSGNSATDITIDAKTAWLYG